MFFILVLCTNVFGDRENAVTLLRQPDDLFTKHLRVGVRGYSGFSTPSQSMQLEISALRRINKVCPDTPHFPRVIKVSQTTFTMTKIGHGLQKRFVSAPLPLLRAISQIENIRTCLRKSRVRHLDIKCQNIAYESTNEVIGLIDFDISMINNTPLTAKLAQLTKIPGYDDTWEQHLQKVILCCFGFVPQHAVGC